MRRLPRQVYPFIALLLIAACLLITLVPRASSGPVQSAKSMLQGIPLYPGATKIYREDTDTPGSKINHQATFCSIECARVTYEALERPQVVLHFYESHATLDKWRTRGSSSPPLERSYYFGPVEFRDWHLGSPDDGFPWFRPRYDMRRDYILDIRTDEKVRGITSVELVIRRLVPMPSDTPIPTLVPPPPTAPLPIVPGSVRTQEPSIPFPVPTAP